MRTRHTLRTFAVVSFGGAGLLAATLFDSACHSSSPTAPTSAWLLKAKLTDLAVSGNATLLAIGQVNQWTAKVNSAQGPLTVTTNVTWTTADPAVATVSPGGLVTAIAFGATEITARLNDLAVTRHVDVLAATGLTLASTSVDGNILHSGVLSFTNVARTAQLTLTGTWPGGLTRLVTADTAWTSLDTAIASVSSSGLLRSIGFGSTSIVARYQSLTLSTRVDVAPVFSSLTIQGTVALTAPGDTSALTVVARFSDGSTKNVSSEVTWTTSNESVATVSSASVVTATGFGQATIAATYLGHVQSTSVTVSPPGTFVISGRARDPGNGGGDNLGVPGFAIQDLQTGRATTTDPTGNYTMVGVVAGDRLRFEKDGWEPTELDIATATDDGSPAVQRVVRLTAGDSAVINTAPNDLRYDLTPAIHCSPCRLIRVVSPTAGTLHLRLTWTGSTSTRLSLWVDGHAFTPATIPPLVAVADVAIGAGETIVYAGLIGGTSFTTGYMQLTLTTSLTAAPLGSSGRPSHKE